MGRLRLALAVVLLTTTSTTQAQQSERFGPWELHYSVVNSTFIEPAVATQYGLTRGRRRAIINLSLREHLSDGSTAARRMELAATSRDLTAQRMALDFTEVREGPAIYYLAEFSFINREYRFFDVSFTPQGSSARYEFTFKQQMYIDE